MGGSSKTPGYSTRIAITSQEEYEWLNAIRQENGLTWRGLMLKAEQRLLVAEQDWPDSLRQHAAVPLEDDCAAGDGCAEAVETGVPEADE